MKIHPPTHLPAFPAFRKNRSWAFTLIELLVVISIIAILAGIALPVFTSVQTKGAQAKDLSNARQIGLGLRLFSSDNNGYFPTTSTTLGANSAFQQIVPTYIPSQKIFYLAGSGWSTGNHPVEVSGTLVLQPGQNAFAYVSGLQDSQNTNFPLVADGFSSTVGQYTTVQGANGGVWKGTKAIVVHVDDSAVIDAVAPSTSSYKVYENNANPDGADIFTPSTNWIPAATVANPL